MSTFQIILLGVFIFLTLLGVTVFALVRSDSLGEAVGVTLWGSRPQASMLSALEPINDANKKSFHITYVEKSPLTIRREFIEALAGGTGPDLIILPHEEILAESDKLAPWPYATYPARTYTDQFIDGAQIFASPRGIIALPVYVDPLVIYYDRARLRELALTTPPATWTQVLALAPTFFRAGARGQVEKSILALGQFGNIPNAKDILSLLLLQAGTPVTVASGGGYRSVLAELGDQAVLPAISALNFFLQFADPVRPTYSWNSGLPSADQAFVNGLTAFYLGHASEWGRLRLANPHLELDVAPVPQTEIAKLKNFGRFYAVAIPNQSPQRAVATLAAYALSGPKGGAALAQAAVLPPALRSLLATPPAADPIQSVFYRAAVPATAWGDPDPVGSEAIFRRLTESVSVGRLKPQQAVAGANQELQFILEH